MHAESWQTCMQDTIKAADRMRMEHVWLVVAAECVNTLCSIADSSNRTFIVEQVGLLLQDQLSELSRFYDEIPQIKQSPPPREVLATLDSAQLAAGFWNTELAADEVRPCFSSFDSHLQRGLY